MSENSCNDTMYWMQMYQQTVKSPSECGTSLGHVWQFLKAVRNLDLGKKNNDALCVKIH